MCFWNSKLNNYNINPTSTNNNMSEEEPTMATPSIMEVMQAMFNSLVASQLVKLMMMVVIVNLYYN